MQHYIPSFDMTDLKACLPTTTVEQPTVSGDVGSIDMNYLNKVMMYD